MGLKNKFENIEQLFLIKKEVISSEASIKKTIEKNEFKTVQVLAMFITLATLTLSTVKAFENRDTYSAVLIIIALASAMLTINYLIYWICRVDKKFDWKKDIVWILLILSSTFYSTCKSKIIKENDKQDNFKYKIDSLKFQLLLKDTSIKWKDFNNLDSLKKH